MVLSLSPGATDIAKAEHVQEHANMWRMVDDVWDLWRDIKLLLKVAEGWYPYISPGTWPDCDMIPLGRISIRGERGGDRMTRLSVDEQYSLMSLFTIFRSPLMFGGDLPSNDDFTLSLLTNKEVLKMHREGTDVRQIFNENDQVAITPKNAANENVYLAIFNTHDELEQDIEVNLKDLGINGDCLVIDMWTGKEVGIVSNTFIQSIKPHASGLYTFIE